MIHKAKEFKVSVGDIVMIKGNNKKREIWKIGIIQEMHRGKDQVTRAGRIKT